MWVVVANDLLKNNNKIKRKNCTISLYGWPKLQITPYGIKNNCNVLMVGENYKLLPEIVFHPQT
jgi:hypothetical protein